MAKATLTRPKYVAQLAKALESGLRGAQVSFEQVRRDRYRFIVAWKKFAQMGHPERQREVWEIADQTLSKDNLLNVAMILTVAPSEVS